MTHEELIQHGLDVAAAYERGKRKGFQQGWDHALQAAAVIDQEEMDANWEDGYATGFEEAVADHEDTTQAVIKAWDDGYLAGVQDAVADPELARKTLASIKSERAAVGTDAPTVN